MCDDSQDFKYVPGDLDLSGPHCAWDEMEKGNDKKAVLLFEAWINKYIGSDYMNDPRFRKVVGSALCDYGVCLLSIDRDSNMTKSLYSFIMASRLSAHVGDDCTKHILSILDRILELKLTEAVPLSANDFHSRWAQSLLEAWHHFQCGDLGEALSCYEEARLLKDDWPHPVQGLILTNYALYRCNKNISNLDRVWSELNYFLDLVNPYSLVYFRAPICSSREVSSKLADLVILKSTIKHFRLKDLNVCATPKAKGFVSLKRLGELEIEFPKDIRTIQFFSMGVVRASKHGGTDFIDLVGSVFPSEQPKLHEKHIGKIFIHAYGDPANPVYFTNWCLIDWIDENSFILTTQTGEKFRNGVWPVCE